MKPLLRSTIYETTSTQHDWDTLVTTPTGRRFKVTCHDPEVSATPNAGGTCWTVRGRLKVDQEGTTAVLSRLSTDVEGAADCSIRLETRVPRLLLVPPVVTLFIGDVPLDYSAKLVPEDCCVRSVTSDPVIPGVSVDAVGNSLVMKGRPNLSGHANHARTRVRVEASRKDVDGKTTLCTGSFNIVLLKR